MGEDPHTTLCMRFKGLVHFECAGDKCDLTLFPIEHTWHLLKIEEGKKEEKNDNFLDKWFHLDDQSVGAINRMKSSL